MSHALMRSRHRIVAAASAVSRGVLYTTISAGMVLARTYMTGRGVDQDFANRYGSPFGRTAAKVYRTEHGTEPRKAWSNVNGKWRRVNGFLPAESAVLDVAFATYKRTAEYVLTETVTTADEPAEVECRIPGCDGTWHYDDMCDVVLADMSTAGVDLIAEVDSVDGGPVELVVWEGEGRDLLRTSDPAAGRAFADRLRALAHAIDKGAVLLMASARAEVTA